MHKVQLFIGVDVQISRGCAYYALDHQADFVDSGWIYSQSLDKMAANLRYAIEKVSGGDYEKTAIAIDAPRRPMPEPRRYYWDSRQNDWRRKTPKEKGFGRHCEVVIKALGLGNPQWTPFLEDAPLWMRLGFRIFANLIQFKLTFEVFPTASLKMLREDRHLRVGLNLADFNRGPKDMLDACIAAATVFEFINGRGCEVGDADGLGTIVLPRGINTESKVLLWPKDQA